MAETRWGAETSSGSETRSGHRVVRWLIGLSIGAVLAIVLGFAAGLARPRAQTPRIGLE
ncbi:MAG TPA: hypothetical protein VFP34_15755 [Microlunatus sp.]|nr:hypothetical protein [Microlunatus sp.]